MGGLEGHARPINEADVFETTVNRVLGDKIRADKETSQAMWAALANNAWTHEDGTIALYSFRAAGDFIAAIRGTGDYLNWYCSGPAGVVREDIAQALAAEGWTFQHTLDFLASDAWPFGKAQQ